MKYTALGTSTAKAELHVSYEHEARQQRHGYKTKDLDCDASI